MVNVGLAWHEVIPALCELVSLCFPYVTLDGSVHRHSLAQNTTENVGAQNFLLLAFFNSVWLAIRKERLVG